MNILYTSTGASSDSVDKVSVVLVKERAAETSTRGQPLSVTNKTKLAVLTILPDF